MELQKGVCVCCNVNKVIANIEQDFLPQAFNAIFQDNILNLKKSENLINSLRLCPMCYHKINLLLKTSSKIEIIQPKKWNCFLCNDRKSLIKIKHWKHFLQIAEDFSVSNKDECYACSECLFYMDMRNLLKEKLLSKYPQLTDIDSDSTVLRGKKRKRDVTPIGVLGKSKVDLSIRNSPNEVDINLSGPKIFTGIKNESVNKFSIDLSSLKKFEALKFNKCLKEYKCLSNDPKFFSQIPYILLKISTLPEDNPKQEITSVRNTPSNFFKIKLKHPVKKTSPTNRTSKIPKSPLKQKKKSNKSILNDSLIIKLVRTEIKSSCYNDENEYYVGNKHEYDSNVKCDTISNGMLENSKQRTEANQNETVCNENLGYENENEREFKKLTIKTQKSEENYEKVNFSMCDNSKKNVTLETEKLNENDSGILKTDNSSSTEANIRNESIKNHAEDNLKHHEKESFASREGIKRISSDNSQKSNSYIDEEEKRDNNHVAIEEVDKNSEENQLILSFTPGNNNTEKDQDNTEADNNDTEQDNRYIEHDNDNQQDNSDSKQYNNDTAQYSDPVQDNSYTAHDEQSNENDDQQPLKENNTSEIISTGDEEHKKINKEDNNEQDVNSNGDLNSERNDEQENLINNRADKDQEFDNTRNEVYEESHKNIDIDNDLKRKRSNESGSEIHITPDKKKKKVTFSDDV